MIPTTGNKKGMRLFFIGAIVLIAVLMLSVATPTWATPQQEPLSQTVPAVVSIDTPTSVQSGATFTAQVNVENLLDKKYYNRVGFYDGVYWGEPRNVMMTLRWKL